MQMLMIDWVGSEGGRIFYHLEDHREVVEEIIEFLDLQAYRQSRISDCPYGVQKRCEIGRAIAMEPRLLLLDEPIAGLTAEQSGTFQRYDGGTIEW